MSDGFSTERLHPFSHHKVFLNRSFGDDKYPLAGICLFDWFHFLIIYLFNILNKVLFRPLSHHFNVVTHFKLVLDYYFSKFLLFWSVQGVEDEIALLDTTVLKNANMQNALLNKLNAVIANIEAGNYADAMGQLQNDILGKTNGCANTGAPDKNDWIKNCTAQSDAYTRITDAIAMLSTLIAP